MIDTVDLTSYYPGYDEYLESEEMLEKYDYSDELLEQLKERKGELKMERKIIDLNNTNFTLDDIFNLENYVWENDKLIPAEMIGD